MIRPHVLNLREIGLLAGALALLSMPSIPAQAQGTITRDDMIAKLDHFEAPAEIDIPALKQQVLQKAQSRSKNEPPANKRPPVAPELDKLPTLNLDIQFDIDTPIVQPASYQTVGRIADAMVHSNLLPYTFLIVGHIESTGRREANLLLSQRRADAIREILVNTFKISAKRIQSIGLGEEQLLDASRPNAPVNGQLQIMTVAKVPDQTEQPAAKPAPPPAKKPARKR